MAMFLKIEDRISRQKETLPEGYELITSGQIIEGDLRWNVYDDCWNLSDITRSPKHDIILNDSVSNFGGVCRKIGIGPTNSKSNVIDSTPQYITL